MKRALIYLAVLVAGCSSSNEFDQLVLESRLWVCTKQVVVSIHPYAQRCVQYSRLAE